MKAICKYFDINGLQNKLSAPWAIAAMKNLTVSHLTRESTSLSAHRSATTISVSKILSRRPSANISARTPCKLNWAYLELLQLWIIPLHTTWRWNSHHTVNLQVRWQSQYQIFCPESPLEKFQYECPENWSGPTLSYRSSEYSNCNPSYKVIFITQCTSKCSNNLLVKDLVPKAICKYFSINTLETELSAPWAIATVNNSNALHETSGSSSCSAHTSAVTISVSNILARKPSGNILVLWTPRKLNWTNLELLPLWKCLLHRFSCWNLCQPVHVQVQQQILCQISCPEGHLQIFQYEKPAHRTECTLSYSGYEYFHCTLPDVGIFIAQCTSKCSNDLRMKYLVLQAICKCFKTNTLKTELSAPWAIAAVKIWTVHSLTLESSWPRVCPRVCPSPATISMSNIASRKSSANISVLTP